MGTHAVFVAIWQQKVAFGMHWGAFGAHHDALLARWARLESLISFAPGRIFRCPGRPRPGQPGRASPGRVSPASSAAPAQAKPDHGACLPHACHGAKRLPHTKGASQSCALALPRARSERAFFTFAKSTSQDVRNYRKHGARFNEATVWTKK